MSSSPPCRHFLRGACRYGDACKFAHAARDADAARAPEAEVARGRGPPLAPERLLTAESTLPETRMRALAEAGRERARRACGDAAAAGSETFSPCAVRGRSGYVTPPSIGAPFIVSQQN